jgi:MFS family permease
VRPSVSGPARRLALASLLMTAGNGAFMTCSAIYFTRVAGLAPTTLGLGLTIAGATGLFASVPLGHLADRHGPRGATALFVALNGVAAAGYLLVRSFPVFLVMACAFVVFQRGSRAAQQALMAGLLRGDAVARTQAMVRSVNNIGIAVGAACASIALQIGTPTAFSVVLVADALSFFASAVVLLTLPVVSPTAAGTPGEPRWVVFRDGPFAVYTALMAVIGLYSVLLEVVMPLWIVTYTHASTAAVTGLFLVNTISVVLFQIQVSARVSSMSRAADAGRLSGVVLLAACVLFALTAGGSPVVATCLLIAAAIVLTWGEMLASAAWWTISFGLAPAGKQGQYQGFFFTGYATMAMVAPTLLTFLLIQWGTPGWYVLGAMFLLAALPMRWVVNWAERARGDRAAATEKDITAQPATPS